MNIKVYMTTMCVRMLLAGVLVVACLNVAVPAHAQKLIASTNPERMAASEPAAKTTAPPEKVPSIAVLTTGTSAQLPPVPPPITPERFLGRLEVSQWGTSVSNDFGSWYGGGVHLFLDPTPQFSMVGEVFYEHRPSEIEQAGSLGTTIHLTPWFYTSLAVSGGGPDDPAAFLPRFRYDVNGTLATPIPGFHLTGGWTRIYYGNPVGGRILRAGFLQYAGKVILQGNVNFNNNRPGNHKSVDGVGAIQVGEEGRYWVGLIAGGGREAWQTQGLFPINVEFDGFHISVFVRKWITRSFGVNLRYNHYTKRTAYHSNGGEIRFFWQF